MVLDKYTISKAERSRTIYNRLQYFSPEDLEREFMECGFTIENYYSDVSGTPSSLQSREFALIAKSPGEQGTGKSSRRLSAAADQIAGP